MHPGPILSFNQFLYNFTPEWYICIAILSSYHTNSWPILAFLIYTQNNVANESSKMHATSNHKYERGKMELSECVWLDRMGGFLFTIYHQRQPNKIDDHNHSTMLRHNLTPSLETIFVVSVLIPLLILYPDPRNRTSVVASFLHPNSALNPQLNSRVILKLLIVANIRNLTKRSPNRFASSLNIHPISIVFRVFVACMHMLPHYFQFWHINELRSSAIGKKVRLWQETKTKLICQTYFIL